MLIPDKEAILSNLEDFIYGCWQLFIGIPSTVRVPICAVMIFASYAPLHWAWSLLVKMATV